MNVSSWEGFLNIIDLANKYSCPFIQQKMWWYLKMENLNVCEVKQI